uniref:Uncharacterized protein AlNc14C112G6426 n=1 Tax=Albugo laibachii Nc14 TaxID=890382 RepID=F0WIM5_9STRA|nr:conserved hypothetical protein [Albugo laibachii Nc14]|eukprot:CCA21111.1 conserved hypothetical protein [Albugo laibachii Nc14]
MFHFQTCEAVVLVLPNPVVPLAKPVDAEPKPVVPVVPNPLEGAFVVLPNTPEFDPNVFVVAGVLPKVPKPVDGGGFAAFEKAELPNTEPVVAPEPKLPVDGAPKGDRARIQMRSHRVQSKLYKQFLTNLKRCDSLEKEGDHVLSSLGNLYKRLELQTSGHNMETEQSIFGVLAMCENLPALLYRAHILAIEKCRMFLRGIMADYGRNVEQLKSTSLDYRQAIHCDMDLVPLEGGSSPLLTLEWMEDVANMAQLEMMRKKAIVHYLVTSVDAQRVLALVNGEHWSSKSPYSNMDMQYVRNALMRIAIIESKV